MIRATVNDPARTRRTTYVVLAVAFLLLLGVALVAFSSNKSTAEAEQKADQFIAELTAAGLRAPSQDQVVRLLGDDGGALCDDPASALNRAAVYGTLVNGAGGPGSRPVIADNNVLKGQLLAIKVYCPDELAEFTELADALKTADVAKG
jgi:Tfp pilus assembly protein FimT